MVTAAGSGTQHAGKKVVLLDCDPGIDDAMAIVDLLARRAFGEIDIAGLIATAGNASVDDCVSSALSWLELGERTDRDRERPRADQPPVFKGAAGPVEVAHDFTPETHGEHGRGYAPLARTERAPSSVHGARAWSELSIRHESELHAVVIGPLSTLATALDLDGGIPDRLASLTIMGGTFCGHPGNTTAVAEWNSHFDPEAAQRVCEGFAGSSVVPRWCGQNVTDSAIMSPADVTEVLSVTRGAPVTRALAAALRFYFEFHDAVGEGYCAKVHDPIATGIALEPALGRWSPARIDVATSDRLTRGQTVAEFRPERWRGGDYGSGRRNADILLGIPGHSGRAGVDDLLAQWKARHVRWARG